MALWKYTQRTFNGGVLDKELMGRQDLSKYFCGASLLKNFLVRRQGNLAKRRGTDFAANITNILGYTYDASTGAQINRTIRKSRIIPIVHERDKGFYALLTGRLAFLVDSGNGVYCNDGVWRKNISNYNFTGVHRFPSGSECVLDGTYYKTLREAVLKSYAGCQIDLRKDIELADALPFCRGKINLNGHTITITNAAVTFSFGNETGSSECGLVDLTHPNTGDNVVWSSGVMATASTVFITHSLGGYFKLDGIRATCPFTGSSSCFLLDTSNTLGRGLIQHCNVTCKGGNGFLYVKGNQSDDPDTGKISINECDITYLNANYYAIRNAVTTSLSRFVYFDASSLVATKYASNCGLHVSGGVVTHASGCFGYSATYDSSFRSRLTAGLFLNGTSTTETSGYPYSECGIITERKGETTLDGVTYGNYNMAQEEAYVYSRTPATPSTPEPYPDVPSNSDPYCVEIPYEDGDLDQIDTFQSGDTIFLAHKYYPAAKLVFSNDDFSLTYSTIEFNATTWDRPIITGIVSSINLEKSDDSVSGTTTYRTKTTYSTAASTKTTAVYKVTKSGSTETETLVSSSVSTLAPRTIKYCVTYVKDGVESAPSNPVSVTYLAPWESGGKVTINFSKGSNAEEPDYYNIYKCESTEFGLIGSTTKPFATDLFPDMSGWYDSPAGETYDQTFDVTCVDTATFNGNSLRGTDTLDILNSTVGSTVTKGNSKVNGSFGDYVVYSGSGGCHFGYKAKAVFDFGTRSGVSANSFQLSLDAHTIRYVEDAATGKVKVYDVMNLTGKRIKAKVSYTPKNGSQTVSSQTVTVNLDPVSYTPEGGSETSAYSGNVEHYCGSVDAGASFADVNSLVNRSVRTATVTFSDLSSGVNQITKLEVECLDDLDDGSGTAVETNVDCYLCGIKFVVNDPKQNSFDDDYITPDLTVTPPSDEEAFRGRGNYPSCVGLYQQRLIFAATEDQPFGFWMSAVGDLYNFSPHSSIREDDAISAELAATEFPNINHIVMNRDIIMLGDGGEWKIAPVTGNTITYKTVSAELQSSIGSAKWLKPITVGNEVIFAERTGMTLRSIVYNYASDGYESTDLSVLSGDLFADNRIERMCYKQHPDSTIECVLADGTVATMVYMPEHEVAAWSLCTLGGGYLAKDIATSKALNGNTTDVMLTVRKGDEWELWSVRPDLPELTVDAQTCMDRVQSLTAAEAASGWVTGWTAVDCATGAVVTASSGLVSDHTYLCGFAFDAEYVSVRPEPAGNETIQFEIKNARSAEVRMLNAGDFTVRGYDVDTTRTTDVATGFSMAGGANVEKDYDVILSGKNTKDGRVSIKSSTPNPCSILSVSVVYQIEQRDLNSKE